MWDVHLQNAFAYNTWPIGANNTSLQLSFAEFLYNFKGNVLLCMGKCNTAKPLYSGHHREREKVSTIERCPLHTGSS